jgi:hypothetical protein
MDAMPKKKRSKRPRPLTLSEKWTRYTHSSPHKTNREDYRCAATFREERLLLGQNLWAWI